MKHALRTSWNLTGALLFVLAIIGLLYSAAYPHQVTSTDVGVNVICAVLFYRNFRAVARAAYAAARAAYAAAERETR